jgi:hypothetical protein
MGMASWWAGKFGKKEKQKNKDKKSQQYFNNSVSSHVQARNEVASEYSTAIAKLKQKLSPEERYRNLVITYRSGRDLLVVPEAWMGRDIIVNCTCRKIYVDTPLPAIVRTR